MINRGLPILFCFYLALHLCVREQKIVIPGNDVQLPALKKLVDEVQKFRVFFSFLASDLYLLD
jgi:hypothetical protein